MTDEKIIDMVLDIWNHLGDYPHYHEKWDSNMVEIVRKYLPSQPQESSPLGVLEIRECGVIKHNQNNSDRTD